MLLCVGIASSPLPPAAEDVTFCTEPQHLEALPEALSAEIPARADGAPAEPPGAVLGSSGSSGGGGRIPKSAGHVGSRSRRFSAPDNLNRAAARELQKVSFAEDVKNAPLELQSQRSQDGRVQQRRRSLPVMRWRGDTSQEAPLSPAVAADVRASLRFPSPTSSHGNAWDGIRRAPRNPRVTPSRGPSGELTGTSGDDIDQQYYSSTGRRRTSRTDLTSGGPMPSAHSMPFASAAAATAAAGAVTSPPAYATSAPDRMQSAATLKALASAFAFEAEPAPSGVTAPPRAADTPSSADPTGESTDQAEAVLEHHISWGLSSDGPLESDPPARSGVAAGMRALVGAKATLSAALRRASSGSRSRLLGDKASSGTPGTHFRSVASARTRRRASASALDDPKPGVTWPQELPTRGARNQEDRSSALARVRALSRMSHVDVTSLSSVLTTICTAVALAELILLYSSRLLSRIRNWRGHLGRRSYGAGFARWQRGAAAAQAS